MNRAAVRAATSLIGNLGNGFLDTLPQTGVSGSMDTRMTTNDPGYTPVSHLLLNLSEGPDDDAIQFGVNPHNPQLDWQAAAVWDMEQTTDSYAVIAQRYGRARDTIIKLGRRRNVKKAATARSRKPAAECPVLSPLHKTIGLKISQFDGSNPDRDVPAELMVSKSTLFRLKTGTLEMDLTLMIRIAAMLAVSMPDLVTPQRAFSANFQR